MWFPVSPVSPVSPVRLAHLWVDFRVIFDPFPYIFIKLTLVPNFLRFTKEKVLEMSTWYSILVLQKNLKRFQALLLIRQTFIPLLLWVLTLHLIFCNTLRVRSDQYRSADIRTLSPPAARVCTNICEQVYWNIWTNIWEPTLWYMPFQINGSSIILKSSKSVDN